MSASLPSDYQGLQLYLSTLKCHLLAAQVAWRSKRRPLPYNDADQLLADQIAWLEKLIDEGREALNQCYRRFGWVE
jgi:hypothetical protein